jgi:hypothetical protein
MCARDRHSRHIICRRNSCRLCLFAQSHLCHQLVAWRLALARIEHNILHRPRTSQTHLRDNPRWALLYRPAPDDQRPPHCGNGIDNFSFCRCRCQRHMSISFTAIRFVTDPKECDMWRLLGMPQSDTCHKRLDDLLLTGYPRPEPDLKPGCPIYRLPSTTHRY